MHDAFKKIIEDAKKVEEPITKDTPIKSSGEMLATIKMREALDCGCCYKLPSPVLDMLAVELGLLRTSQERIKQIAEGKIIPTPGDSVEKNIIGMVEVTQKTIEAIFKYISGIVRLEMLFGSEMYTTTMNRHAEEYRTNHPKHVSNCFDNILGIQELILKMIEGKKSGIN